MTTLMLVLCVMVLAGVCHAAGTVRAWQDDGGRAYRLASDVLSVHVDSQTFALSADRDGETFLSGGDLSGGEAGDVSVEFAEVDDRLGAGRAIDLTWESGRRVRVALYPDVPFLCVTASVHNPTAEAVEMRDVLSFAADVMLPGRPADVRLLASDGLRDLSGQTTSYLFAALAQPHTRRGVVAGWLTCERGSGVVVADAADGTVRLAGRCEYGRLRIESGQTALGETLAIGSFDDCLTGLERYADAIARAGAVELPRPIPSGYCTWYHARALDQERLAELAAWCDRHLRPFGLDAMQIDDGWQVSGRDFTIHDPAGPYSAGMAKAAGGVRAHGLAAGIWLIPFGWDPSRAIFADRQDYFARRPDGSLYEVHWAGTCLDCTNPAAREFLADVVRRMTREWGFNYLKIDGLWTGTATETLYPDLSYGDDRLGEAVLGDPGMTQIEAYRAGLRTVRAAAGDDVFLLGCNIAQNMRTLGASIGLVDGMRIGPDVGAEWERIVRCAEPAGWLYFLNGRVWFNDPDCLMLREPLTVDQGRLWGTLIALAGQMNLVSEWLPDLPADRLETLKRTLPSTGATGRPVDLFAHALPRIWHLGPVAEDDPSAADPADQRQVVGLLNWSDKDEELVAPLSELGLPDGPANRYVGFDFWEDQFLAPMTDRLALPVRPTACRAVTLVPLADRPQLLGTSRHVAQGAVGDCDASWDAESRVLRGRCRLVAGDPFELRICAPPEPVGWQLRRASAARTDETGEAAVRGVQKGPWVRVTIESPLAGPVEWHVLFDADQPRDDSEFDSPGPGK